MTPKEFLQANLLDILFENRNKDYGAYALRRDYNHRLWIAVISGLCIAGLVFLASLLNGKKSVTALNNFGVDSVIIKTFTLPEKDPEMLNQQRRPAAATIRDAQIRIVSNDESTDVPTEDEREGRQTSTETTEGSEYINTGPIQTPVENTTTNQPEIPAIPNRVLFHRQAEFPGGPELLKKFLAGQLVPPSDLEPGEIVRVEVRFTIASDGKVSGFEIITSGGREFDQEVLRVCRRMPNWIPAQQNGIEVPVNYILPVTFISMEQ